MIDFRYHLVSLISVFLALAVGIALGAGPLKESIGDTLTGQVDQLRAEKDQLRTEADVLSADLADSRAALESLRPSLLSGVLGGRRVAIVVLDTVDVGMVKETSTAINQAGGTVSAVATVSDAWTDPTRTAFRQSLASTMLSYLDSVPPADAGVDVELAQALVESLTTADPTNPDALSQHAGVMLDLLSGDAGLVSLASPVTAPADAVVVLAGPIVSAQEAAMAAATSTPTFTSSAAPTGPLVDTASGAATPSASTSPSTGAAEQAERVAAWTDIALAAQHHSTGAVVVTSDVTSGGLVHAIRTDTDLSGTLSTVDSIHSPQGIIAVPLALADRIAGVVDQYGSGDGAKVAMPDRVALPPIERVPSQPVDPSGAPTDGATSTSPAGSGQTTGQG
jgi:hypothetical protein